MDGDVVGARLSATKLTRPSVPAGTFARSRLHALMDAGSGDLLTVVVGPPGSGKTVLVSSWARWARMPVAWLALDGADSRPRRFWTGVARALRRAGVDNVAEPEPDAFKAGDAGDDYITALVDALSDQPAPVVLVLDDFHEVGHAVVAQVDRLLDWAPPSLRLVLVSRRDPPLRLPRLRLSGRVTEIRSGDLACTPEEVATLLAGAGTSLPAAVVARLWERTEGWMAPLVLAAISLRTAASPEALVEQLDGQDLAISDYLMSEVLAHQPDDVQTFLLQTSILDVLEGGLVDAVTGGTGGRGRLVSLTRDGVLVTPIDRRGRWFRYHALFRDLLRAELSWRHPETVPRLHARAAAWYAAAGEDARALRHAVAAGSWDLASALASQRWIDLLVSGELDVLAPLLVELPEHSADDDVGLAVALAAVSLHHEPLEQATVRLRTARGALAHTAGRSTAATEGLALVELLHAGLTGEYRHALAAARKLLGRQDADAPIPDPGLRSLVLTYLGSAESWTGESTQAREHLRAALSAAEQARSPWLRLQALGYLALAEFNCGDVPAAQRRAEQALEVARERGWMRATAVGTAAMVAALVATQQCRFDEGEEYVRIAERVSLRSGPVRAAVAFPKLELLAAEGRHRDALDVVRAGLAEVGTWPVEVVLVNVLRAWEARLMLACGDRAGADRVLEALTGPEALLALSTRARLMIDDGHPRQAREAIASALTSEGAVAQSIRLDLWLVDALALDHLGDAAAAAKSLEQALDLAAPGDLLRPIVAHGAAILPLLKRHLRMGTNHGAMVDRALMLIEGGQRRIKIGPTLPEPLSERERQVLGFLPTIMSNADIAAELFLSVNTVKTHVRSIYRKLGVDNRREAVALARELGLFASR